jgi:hypothetical protein
MIGYLRHLVCHDFWLKFLSLALAVLAWLTVSKVFIGRDLSPGQGLIEQDFYNIPLSVTLPAAGSRAVTVNPTAIQVTVQGPPRRLNNLHSEDIRAGLNLTGIGSATRLRKEIDVEVPEGFSVTRIIPREAEVNVPPVELR